MIEELGALPDPDGAAGSLLDSIDLIVPHQANKTMVTAAGGAGGPRAPTGSTSTSSTVGNASVGQHPAGHPRRGPRRRHHRARADLRARLRRRRRGRLRRDAARSRRRRHPSAVRARPGSSAGCVNAACTVTNLRRREGRVRLIRDYSTAAAGDRLSVVASAGPPAARSPSRLAGTTSPADAGVAAPPNRRMALTKRRDAPMPQGKAAPHGWMR